MSNKLNGGSKKVAMKLVMNQDMTRLKVSECAHLTGFHLLF
jgi:hypothetical protein